MDNIPGPGRVIDTYIYQRFGRKIENLALRIRLSTLEPTQILRSFQLEPGPLAWVYFVWDVPLRHTPLKEIIDDISNSVPRGSTIVAGLKSLVKQTRSKSLYRSSSALAALIYMSMAYVDNVYDAFARFYSMITDDEHIFHLEDHAKSLDDSHPDKPYVLILPTIAHACSSLYLRLRKVTPLVGLEFACLSRERLLGLIESHRHVFEESKFYANIGEGCTWLADITIFMRSWKFPKFYPISMDRALQSITETCYFLIILLIRAILRLHCHSNELTPVLLGLMTHFFDAVVSFYISAFSNLRASSLEFAHFAGLIRSVFHSTPTLRALFPNAFVWIHKFTFALAMFPRRIQADVKAPKDPPAIQEYTRIWIRRSRRLLTSSDELEREVRESLLSTGLAVCPATSPDVDVAVGEDIGIAHSLERAKSVFVLESELSDEFLLARRSRETSQQALQAWGDYIMKRRMRHKWGQLLCSHMDWNWDMSASLRRFFEFKVQINSSHSTAGVNPNVAILTLSETVYHQSLPKEIRVPYTTDSGEIGYQSYFVSNHAEVSSLRKSSDLDIGHKNERVRTRLREELYTGLENECE